MTSNALRFFCQFLSETGASTYKLYKALAFKDVKKGEWVMVMNKNEKFLGKRKSFGLKK